MNAKEAREKTDKIIHKQAENISVSVIADIVLCIDTAINNGQYFCDVDIPWRTLPFVKAYFEPLDYKIVKLGVAEKRSMDCIRISW